MKKQLLKRLTDTKGSAFLISYFAIVVLLGLGATFLLLVTGESRVSERQRLTTVAFHIAEAGIERGLNELREDFVNDTSPSWADGLINTYTIGPNTGTYYTIPFSSTVFNSGSYVVELLNVSGAVDDIWLRSTGIISGVTHTIDVYVRMVSLSPWEYAIFAGAGASGAMVNGNVDIRGSVIVLGSGLSPGDYAIDLGGTAELVGNNYNGLSGTITAKVPALPTVSFGGETVETLNATLRVKQGLVGLSGSSTVGESNATGNAVKETVDGVFVTEGFGGSQGTSGVHSDNGVTEAYDLGGAVTFPSLSDPYPGHASYQAYLQSTGYTLTAAEAAVLSSGIKPTSSFSFGDANGSISVDGSGNLAIDGVVYVDSGADVNFEKDGSNKTINYTGTGSLLVTGNVQIDVNLYTAGNNSFPNNIMGIMTPNNIGFNEANIDVMGIFYAENSVVVQKQTDIMGTIVSNYFDMGTNVPSIFQVPDTANNLPPGMIGGNATWYMVVGWLKS